MSQEKKSEVFAPFKKPAPVVDVNRELDSKAASSAEQATAEIEKVAKQITDLPHTTLVSKDPSSQFMTSRDVLNYQKALNLGIIRTVRTSKVIAPPTGSGGEPVTIEAMMNSMQSCPVCSLVTHSNFQMQFVEDAAIWYCFRCGITIDPFNKVSKEVLPTDQTEFGLFAIDDPGEKVRSGGNNEDNSKFPVVSNRKRKKNPGAFDRLENYRKKDKDLKTLRNFKKQ